MQACYLPGCLQTAARTSWKEARLPSETPFHSRNPLRSLQPSQAGSQRRRNNGVGNFHRSNPKNRKPVKGAEASGFQATAKKLEGFRAKSCSGAKIPLERRKNLLTDHKKRLIAAANEGFSTNNGPGISYSIFTSVVHICQHLYCVFYAFQTDILANTQVNKQLQTKFSPKSTCVCVCAFPVPF